MDCESDRFETFEMVWELELIIVGWLGIGVRRLDVGVILVDSFVACWIVFFCLVDVVGETVLSGFGREFEA